MTKEVAASFLSRETSSTFRRRPNNFSGVEGREGRVPRVRVREALQDVSRPLSLRPSLRRPRRHLLHADSRLALPLRVRLDRTPPQSL